MGYNETMSLAHAFKPAKWKVILSLAPFVFPLIQIVFAGDWYYKYLSVDAIIVQADIFLVLGGVESIISQPFEPILRPLGWWSRNSLVVAPDGPLLPGSFAVAVTYSMLIYVTWSLISLWRSKRRQGSGKI